MLREPLGRAIVNPVSDPMRRRWMAERSGEVDRSIWHLNNHSPSLTLFIFGWAFFEKFAHHSQSLHFLFELLQFVFFPAKYFGWILHGSPRQFKGWRALYWGEGGSGNVTEVQAQNSGTQ